MIANKIAESAKRTNAHSDDADALLNEALQMTFPASDPIAISFDHVRATEQGKIKTGRDSNHGPGGRREGK